MNDILDQIQKASIFVREKYSIPNDTIVTPQFEKEFGVKIIYNDMFMGGLIVFKSESHYDLFVLRWT
jgi:hypothetical protein